MWTSNTYGWNSQAGNLRYYYYATVEELQVDEDNNRTQVRIRGYARGAYDPQYEGHTATGQLYLDGAAVGSSTAPSTLGTSWAKIAETTRWITHNEDGTKSITIGISLSCSGSGSYLPASGTATLSPRCTLTKINRGLIRVKTADGWKSGKPYININGEWKLGQAFVYDGEWRRGI